MVDCPVGMRHRCPTSKAPRLQRGGSDELMGGWMNEGGAERTTMLKRKRRKKKKRMSS